MSRPTAPKGIGEAWALRRPERHLLLWCLLCVALGFLLVLGSGRAGGRAVPLTVILPLLVYALSLVAMHLTLSLWRFQGDQILVVAAAFLSGLGLLAQVRMGAVDAADPSGATLYVFPAGVAIMLTIGIAGMQGRYVRLAAGLWVWAGLSLALVAILLVTGQRFRGGVYAAGFVTPTEVLKVTVVLFLASFIDRQAPALSDWGNRRLVPPLRGLLPLAAFWVLLAGLLLLQRDLGMFVILSVALLVMLFIGTRRIGYLVYGVLAASAAGYLVLAVFAHGQGRIQAWWTPFEDPTGNGWQILQGLSGMYSGGLWGEGFGRGNPEYTPIAESDFIYSVIGEELGFVGCTVVVVFFLLLFNRGLRIATRTQSSFGMLVSGGLTAVIATQTFLNVGGVTKFIPLTGITLPFISHGGSSLLTAFASLGLLLAVSAGEPARMPSQRTPAKPASTRRAAPVRRAAPRKPPKTAPPAPGDLQRLPARESAPRG